MSLAAMDHVTLLIHTPIISFQLIFKKMKKEKRVFIYISAFPWPSLTNSPLVADLLAAIFLFHWALHPTSTQSFLLFLLLYLNFKFLVRQDCSSI